MEEQVKQDQKWWQPLRKHRVAIGVGAIVFIVVIALIIIGYWFDWTGFNGYNQVTITRTISGTNAGTVTRTEEYQPGKGLWDWLQLLGILAIPVVAGLGAAWFTRTQQLRDEERSKLQHDRDQQLADQRAESERNAAEQQAKLERELTQDNQRETLLQAYIDKMSELVLNEKLGELTPEGKLKPEYEEVRKIARVRTLTVLRSLDTRRKASVLQFLYESHLIGYYFKYEGKGVTAESIVDLTYADLSGVIMNGYFMASADLSRANLTDISLIRARLDGALLSYANLKGAVLGGAFLSYAHLDAASLSYADLSGAVLEGTILEDADLGGANLLYTRITEEQLATAKSLKGATMPV